MSPQSAWSDQHVSTAYEIGYLRATVTEAEHVRQQQELTVQLLRSRGVSWTVIGEALGVTRQAARQRFSELVLT